MPDILSNSFNKQPVNQMPKKVEAVTSTVKKEEKSFFGKMVDSFVSVDPKTVGVNIWEQIIEPTIKRTIVNSVTSGLSQMFNINVTPQTFNSVFSNQLPSSRISYTEYSAMNQAPQMQPIISNRPMAGIERYPTFEYMTQKDAMDVIENMSELADRYDKAIAVAYLCQFSNEPDAPTDYNFGWSKEMIARAKVIQNYDGKWLISWPKPVPIT